MATCESYTLKYTFQDLKWRFLANSCDSHIDLDCGVITITFEHPGAVYDARMLQPPHEAASPGVKPPRPGPQDGGGPTDA